MNSTSSKRAALKTSAASPMATVNVIPERAQSILVSLPALRSSPVLVSRNVGINPDDGGAFVSSVAVSPVSARDEALGRVLDAIDLRQQCARRLLNACLGGRAREP